VSDLVDLPPRTLDHRRARAAHVRVRADPARLGSRSRHGAAARARGARVVETTRPRRARLPRRAADLASSWSTRLASHAALLRADRGDAAHVSRPRRRDRGRARGRPWSFLTVAALASRCGAGWWPHCGGGGDERDFRRRGSFADPRARRRQSTTALSACARGPCSCSRRAVVRCPARARRTGRLGRARNRARRLVLDVCDPERGRRRPPASIARRRRRAICSRGRARGRHRARAAGDPARIALAATTDLGARAPRAGDRPSHRATTSTPRIGLGRSLLRTWPADRRVVVLSDLATGGRRFRHRGESGRGERWCARGFAHPERNSRWRADRQHDACPRASCSTEAALGRSPSWSWRSVSGARPRRGACADVTIDSRGVPLAPRPTAPRQRHARAGNGGGPAPSRRCASPDPTRCAAMTPRRCSRSERPSSRWCDPTTKGRDRRRAAVEQALAALELDVQVRLSQCADRPRLAAYAACYATPRDSPPSRRSLTAGSSTRGRARGAGPRPPPRARRDARAILAAPFRGPVPAVGSATMRRRCSDRAAGSRPPGGVHGHRRANARPCRDRPPARVVPLEGRCRLARRAQPIGRASLRVTLPTRPTRATSRCARLPRLLRFVVDGEPAGATAPSGQPWVRGARTLEVVGRRAKIPAWTSRRSRDARSHGTGARRRRRALARVVARERDRLRPRRVARRDLVALGRCAPGRRLAYLRSGPRARESRARARCWRGAGDDMADARSASACTAPVQSSIAC